VVGWGLAFVLCMFTVDFTALFCILTFIQKTRLRLVVYLPQLLGEYARTRSGTERYETDGWHCGWMTAIVMNILPDSRNEMRRVVVGMVGGVNQYQLLLYVLLLLFSAGLYSITCYFCL